MAVASPGGREVGRVSVRVVPDTSKFATDTEKYLKRVEKTLKVSIPTTLDTTGVKADLAKLRTELRAFAKTNKLTLTAQVQTGDVQKAIKGSTRKAINEAKRNPVKVPVQANQDDFNTSMRALGKKLAKQAAFKLAITPEDELTRQKLKKLVKSLEKATKVKVSVDPAEAVGQREAVARIVKRIDKIAKTLPAPDVPIELRADTDPLIAQLKRDGKRLGESARAVLPLDAEIESSKLKALLDKLEKTTSVKLPVDVKQRKDLRSQVQGLVKEIEKMAPSPVVPMELRADTDPLIAQLKREGKRIGEKTKTVLPVGAELDSTLLKVLLKRLEETTSVKLPVDVQGRANLRNQVGAIVGQIQRLLDHHLPPEVPVELRADTDPLIAQLKREGKKLGEQVKAVLPVDADLDSHKLKSLLQELEAKTSIRLPVDAVERRDLRSHVNSIVEHIQGLLDEHTNKPVIRPKLDFLDKVFDVARFKAFATQLTLISARFAAYVTLLGPLFLLAASGATALVSSLAVGVPIVAALAAGAGALALGFDALFGPKVDGKRLGGVFTPIIAAVQNLKVEIGALITQGMDPLVDRLLTTAFPVFATGMKRVAIATRGAIQEMLAFASSASFLDSSQALFAGSARSISTVGRSLTFFTSGLMTLAVATLPAMQQVSEELVGLGARFAGFLQRAADSGALQKTINKAVADTFAFIGGVAKITAELIRLLSSLQPIAEKVFAALGDRLSSLITGLDGVLQNLELGANPVLKSVAAAVDDIIAALATVAQHIVQTLALLSGSDLFHQFLISLSTATGQLAGAFGQVADAVAHTVQALGSAFGAPILVAITGITQALGQFAEEIGNNAVLVGLLSTLITVKLGSALLALGASMRLALAARLTTSLKVLGVALTFVKTEAFAAGVAMQEFGTRAAVGSVVSSSATAVRGLGSALGALLVSLGPIAAALIAVTGVFALVQAAQGHVRDATEDAAAGYDELYGSLTGLDRAANARAFDRFNKDIAAANATASQFDSTIGHLDNSTRVFIGAGLSPLALVLTEHKKIWDLLNRGPFTKARGQAAAAAAAAEELQRKGTNAARNLNEVAKETGLSYDTLAKLATQAGLDMSKAFDDEASKQSRAQLVSDLDKVRAITGLTFSQIVDSAGASVTAVQQFGEAVKEAVDATQKAFESQTNLVTNVDLDKTKSATDAVTKAEEKLANAKKDRRQVEERLGVTSKRTALQVVNASTAMADADTKVADAAKDLADAKKELASSTISAQVHDLLKTAQDFNKNITELTKRGLDPKVIQDLLLAGPREAGPLAQALVADNSNRLIKMFNDTAAVLDNINAAVVEKQRLVTMALNSQNPKLAQDLKTGLNIVTILQQNNNASATEIGTALGLDPFTVRDIAHEFGYNLEIALVDAVPPVPVVVKPELTEWHFWMSLPEEKRVKVRWVADDVKPMPGMAMASGGLVKGPGSWTSDSVLARLSNHEFVQPSRSVAHYGVGVMEALRQRRVPRDLLNAIAAGNYALASKLVQANAVATRAPTASPVHAVPASKLEAAESAQSGPRTLTVVDHDGVFRGQMRVAAIKSHRDRAQAERLRRLGKWSS